MAIAVASGVSPERGLYTAIVGGFVVSALGGSRFQIGGPAGAFIVLVSATVAKFGLDGLILTVLLSGLMLALVGVLRLGALIRHMPHPGDRRLHGGASPSPSWPARSRISPASSSSGAEPGPRPAEAGGPGAGPADAEPDRAGRRPRRGGADPAPAPLYGPTWPGMLVAVVAATARRGPAAPARRDHRPPLRRHPAAACPLPHVPKIDLELVMRRCCRRRSPSPCWAALESLLSAKVADSMTGRVAPLEHGTGGPGLGQRRLGLLRRHRRHRHHRADRHQHPRRGARARWRASCTRPSCWPSCSSPAPLASLRAAGGPGRRAGGGRLEHGRDAGVRAACCGTGARRSFCSPPSGSPSAHDLMAGIIAGCAVATLCWVSSKVWRRLRA